MSRRPPRLPEHPTAPPISTALAQICATLAEHPRLVLEAPPGAGKTTAVPPALLDASWLGDQRIVMLEPRRIAARAAADFIAAGLGEATGGRVGYRMRDDTLVGASTRIEVVTEGVLTRMLQADPELTGVGCLIFDEFHERNWQADLGLAFALDVQGSLRPELRIVVMSATLDGPGLARRLGAQHLAVPGRQFDVEVGYLSAERGDDAVRRLQRATERALVESPGDVLVFLPGKGEIAAASRNLRGLAQQRGVDLVPLHGGLPIAAQREALAVGLRRRIVLATNVAESSVTLPGVTAVVDSGLVREVRFDPTQGAAALVTRLVSRASADQRAGRAGRVAPGLAIRLWPESRRLEVHREPEISRIDPSAWLLELYAWGSLDLDVLDAPPAAAVARATGVLAAVGAIEAGAISPLGRRMLALALPPRAAAVALQVPPPLRLVAELDAADRRRHGSTKPGSTPEQVQVEDLDVLIAGPMDDAMRRATARLARRLDVRADSASPPRAAGPLLVAGFADRIAVRDPNGGASSGRYLLADSSALRLPGGSALDGAEYLVVVEWQIRERDGERLIRRASRIDAADVRTRRPDLFRDASGTHFDESLQRVVARRQQRFGSVILAEHPGGRVDAEAAASELLIQWRQRGIERLPFGGGSAQLRGRIDTLRRVMPELDLPAVDDATLSEELDTWLPSALLGQTAMAELDDPALARALNNRLDHRQRSALDRLVPLNFQTPSGQRVDIRYDLNEPPTIAAKLQSLFGLSAVGLADGRITPRIELLSPAGRPLAVTADLASFWRNGYADVRRDMRGRYPRHPWPEDPLTALASHRAKPRTSPH